MGETKPESGGLDKLKRNHCHFSMLKMQEAAKFWFLRQNQQQQCFRSSFVDTSGSFFDEKRTETLRRIGISITKNECLLTCLHPEKVDSLKI
jgi:hypothetical protein